MKKANTLILILLAVFFVSTITFIYLYFSKPKEKIIIVESSVPTKTITSPAPSLIPTSSLPQGWKTYVNKNLGFSINVPDSWIIRDNGNTISLDSPETVQMRKEIPQETPPELIIQKTTVEKLPSNKTAKSLEEWLYGQGTKDYGLVGNIEKISINNYPAYKGKFSGMVLSESIYLPHNQDIFIFDQVSETIPPLLNQIISTFKFN